MSLHNYFADLTTLAETTAPREAVAFLFYDGAGSLQVEAAANQATGAEQFSVSPLATRQAMSRPDYYGFFHSHCQSGATFSEMDLLQMRVSACPWLLYSTETHTFNWQCPPTHTNALVGRRFILGVQDCAALVSDFYARYFSIHFPFFARPPLFLDTGYTLTRQLAQQHGFVEVAGPAQPNDMLFFQWRVGQPITHVGVLLRENRLLHQVCKQVSLIEQFSAAWQDRVVAIYRREDFTSKLVNL